MIDSGSSRRDESNDMCFEAGHAQIASAKHVHCDETHIIRFVSTSRTRIRQVRIDWLSSLRDIAVFLCACAVTLLRSYCACADENADISKRFQPIYAQMIDSGSSSSRRIE